jgi:hypothetical protein
MPVTCARPRRWLRVPARLRSDARSRKTTKRPERTGRGGFKIQAESKFQNFFEGPDEGGCLSP